MKTVLCLHRIKLDLTLDSISTGNFCHAGFTAGQRNHTYVEHEHNDSAIQGQRCREENQSLIPPQHDRATLYFKPTTSHKTHNKPLKYKLFIPAYIASGLHLFLMYLWSMASSSQGGLIAQDSICTLQKLIQRQKKS